LAGLNENLNWQVRDFNKFAEILNLYAMLNREILIEYIRKNDSRFSYEELESYPFTTLVLIKVRVELELYNKKLI